jgi:hypothetical protein
VIPVPGDKRGEKKLIRLARLQFDNFDIWEITVAEVCAYRTAFLQVGVQAEEAQLFALP